MSCFFAFLILASSSFASTFYLSPSSSNIPQNSTISVKVGINTASESINAFSAILSYPQDKLEVTSISYGSSFAIAAEGSYGGGSIRISRGSITGASGNLTLATIGFKGKSQGAATVSFVGGSAAPRTSDSSDSLGGSTGGVFTVVKPLPQGSVDATKPIVKEPFDATKPIISNVRVTTVSTNSAVIVWQTNEKADSVLEYGLTPNKYFLSYNDKNLLLDHLVKLEGEALTPGTVFHFRVKSKDEAGNEAVGNDSVFQIKGFDVKIKLIDSSGRPLKDREVTLYSSPLKSISDQNGEVIFKDVTPGRHLVVVKFENDAEQTREIDVKENSVLSEFTLTIKPQTNNALLAIFYGGLVIIICVVIGILIARRRKSSSTVTDIPPDVKAQ